MSSEISIDFKKFAAPSHWTCQHLTGSKSTFEMILSGISVWQSNLAMDNPPVMLRNAKAAADALEGMLFEPLHGSWNDDVSGEEGERNQWYTSPASFSEKATRIPSQN